MFMKKGSYLFLASSILASTVVTAIPPSNGIVAKAVVNSEKTEKLTLKTTLEDGLKTKANNLSFTIWAENAAGTSVIYNGTTVTNNGKTVEHNSSQSDQSSFRYNIKLSEGDNVIKVTVKNGTDILEKEYTVTKEASLENKIGDVVFSIDTFVLGKGYVVEPIRIPITTETKYEDLLKQLHYTLAYKTSGQLLSGDFPNLADGISTLPEPIEKLFNKGDLPDLTDLDLSDGLGTLSDWELDLDTFDLFNSAGWRITHNNVAIPISWGDDTALVYLQDQDVIRTQFTFYNGAELSSFEQLTANFSAVSRDEALRSLAYINSSEEKSELLQDADIATAYEALQHTIQQFGIEQTTVDERVAALNEAVVDWATETDERENAYMDDFTNAQLQMIASRLDALVEQLPSSDDATLVNYDDVIALTEKVAHYPEKIVSKMKYANQLTQLKVFLDDRLSTTIQSIMTKIDALPSSDEMTAETKIALDDIQNVYKTIPTSQRVRVTNFNQYEESVKAYTQFEKIQAVEAQIAALPTVANVQLTDEEAIQAARAAFQALAADAQARVSNEAVLQKVEEQLLTLKELAVGQTEAVKSITKIIDTLPKASTITLAHQTLIQTTYDAFVALSASEQKNVANAFDLMVAKALIDDLVASEVRKKSVEVMTKIAALPAISLLDVSDEPAYVQAQFAYDVLTEAEKKAVTNAETLPEIAAQLAILKQDVTTVKTMIANLPLASQVSETNREAIEKARRAYESLTVAQKKMVTNSGTLEAVELKLAENQTARVQQVVETIQRLPVAITVSQEKAIANARAMYDALTLPNQVLVTNYATLLDAEAQLDTLIRADEEAARKVETLLYELPFTIVASDEATVTQARKAYNKLTFAQRLYVTNVELLEQAEAALVALAEKDVAAAQKVVKAIDALPTKAKLKLTNATALKAARTKYSALKTTQKQYVDNYDVLLQLEKQMVLLQKRDKALKVKDIDIDIPTIKNTTKVIQGYVTPKAKVVVYKGTKK
ncbi:hypothetical protein [Kurthia senegalensis]|uniref:hypothetical protein n=1 Tax=Kurthia senegalensis TaxID=1033740 RepID=UPI000288D18F|nr:hypothetical protein [Kurthia senegalensis]